MFQRIDRREGPVNLKGVKMSERKRVQLKEGGKINSGRESRWERKQYIPCLRLGERMKEKV